MPLPCFSDVFTKDSSRCLFISEFKPSGGDRFIEFWNCRSETFHADTLYLEAAYEGLRLQAYDVTVPPGVLTSLVFHEDFPLRDAVRVTAHSGMFHDTVLLAYAVSSPEYSISYCDWYRETVPTPGYENGCLLSTGITETHETYYDELVTVTNGMGQIMFHGFYSHEIERKLRGNLVIIYFEKRKILMRKYFF